MKILIITAALTYLLFPEHVQAQTAASGKNKPVEVNSAKSYSATKAKNVKGSSIQPARSKATTIEPALATKTTEGTAVGSGSLQAAKPDSAKSIKVMTHAEIEAMMAERALVMKEMLHKPAPAFTATDLNGKEYKLSELKGKVVVLNFWFIGCKPCVMKMPHLNDLVKRYKDEDVVFLAFSLDDESSLRKFLTKKTFDYNIIPDAANVAQQTYKINSFPTSLVIDKNGIVQDYLIGYSTDVEQQLAAFIDKSLQ